MFRLEIKVCVDIFLPNLRKKLYSAGGKGDEEFASSKVPSQSSDK